MYLRILLGFGILLATTGTGLMVGYLLHLTGQLAGIESDKSAAKALIVADRDAVRARARANLGR